MIHFPNSRSVWVAAARLGGLGKVPVAPGTVATLLAGVPAAFLLSLVGSLQAVVIVSLLIIASCYWAEIAEQECGTCDPSEVVVDELVGFLVTMLGFPITYGSLGLGIVSFRLMDIYKPWPVNLFQEKFKGGMAIVLDDVAAGVLAHAVVWVGLKFCS